MEHRSPIPAPLLVQHLPNLPKGKALDFASGYGRNAFYLASKGYQVEGFDRNEAAVVFCNEKATKDKLPFAAFCTDLEKDIPFSDQTYDLVSCFYYLDRNIIPKLKASLKPGGVIVYETFLIDQHQLFGKPSRRAFCWEHNELLINFSDFRILFYNESIIFPDGEDERGTWVAQLIAKRIS